MYAKNVDAAYSEFNNFHDKFAELVIEDDLKQHDQAYAAFEYHEVSAYVEELLMEAAKKENPGVTSPAPWWT